MNWFAVREFMPWGSPLVVDLSFFLDHQNRDVMTRKVVGRIYKSLNKAIRMNRTSPVPSAMHLTNFDREGFQELSFIDGNFGESTRQMDVLCTPRNHLDLFPTSQLVYLSADSPNDLGYDVCHDADSLSETVFVIGGLNESPKGMSLAKAEEQGIRHARFPMKRHIGMSVDLAIQHVVKILNDYRLTKDWFYSLRWVPPRYWTDRYNLSEDSEAELCKTILLAQSHLNPECHPELETVSPEQYRRIFQDFLSKHGVTLDSDIVLALLKRPHDVDRLTAASSKKGQKIRRFQNSVRILGIENDVCHEDHKVLNTVR